MRPEERAFKLVQEMGLVPLELDGRGSLDFPVAKQCALVAVKYLMKDEEMYFNGEVDPVRYWKEVKSHIEILTL